MKDRAVVEDSIGLERDGKSKAVVNRNRNEFLRARGRMREREREREERQWMMDKINTLMEKVQELEGKQ